MLQDETRQVHDYCIRSGTTCVTFERKRLLLSSHRMRAWPRLIKLFFPSLTPLPRPSPSLTQSEGCNCMFILSTKVTVLALHFGFKVVIPDPEQDDLPRGWHAMSFRSWLTEWGTLLWWWHDLSPTRRHEWLREREWMGFCTAVQWRREEKRGSGCAVCR